MNVQVEQQLGAGKFFLRIILAMIPCFALWWFIGDWWLRPAVDIAGGVLALLLPESFHSLQLLDGSLQAATNWGEVQGRLVPARAAGYALAFESNVRVLSYSVPFFFALQAALWNWQPKKHIAISLFVMYLVIIVSMVFLCAKSVMVGLGGAFIEANRYWYASRDFIALGFQLSTLMLPVLVPVFLWVLTNQEQLQSLFVSGLRQAKATSAAPEGSE
ncbi:exosortase H-associated membrane protein [uncultured Pseudoteredinibacter sp.]|uniref:exosortase H-associated membrane protein n=1 Tax=uncultured Pseudoteredinibacter sp. TaxID=1641701 RepID=UPI002639630B|nr:exosortase H-associated membrane protein [uncultured Pseudoteredinibacter sp.]